jgi:alanine-glyoxylate transaminase/(R)-3-amino-2-methylpropionate-pyruvate transaminase
LKNTSSPNCPLTTILNHPPPTTSQPADYDVVALRNGYHGLSESTVGAVGLASWKPNVPQGFGVRHALCPDAYRGAFGADAAAYAGDLRELIATSTPGRVAGFLHETIQGVGGAVPLADGYLPRAYDVVRQAGGLCIADEVQTGFGRTGGHYWGFEAQGVVPDIVTLAKGIGNGLPLAAVVTTPTIAARLAERLHFNTFGGNPVCAAAGRAVLRAVDEGGLQANCAAVGAHLTARLRALQAKHDLIGDVRGAGLMLGVELVADRASKAPAVAETAAVFERCKDLGVLLGKGGAHGTVLRIKPPMVFSLADADFLADALDLALSEL